MKTLATAEALRLLAQIGYGGVEIALMRGWAADPAKLGRPRVRICAACWKRTVLPLAGTPQKRAYNLERLKMASSLAHELAPARSASIRFSA